MAELASDECLARDGEGHLAGAGVAEAAGAQRERVATGDAIDVALVDDSAVRVEEVEGDGRATIGERGRPV